MTSTKKLMSCILALLMLFTVTAPVIVSATDVAAAPTGLLFAPAPQEEILNMKTEGDFNYIKINEDTEIEIVGYTGSDTVVKVPSKINSVAVTSVGNYCFSGNETVTEIKLNSAVTNIGDGAFMNCTALKKVSSADSVTSLGVSCFEGCTAIEEYKVPDPVTAVPERAFFGCSSLKDVQYHKNLKNVAKDAFTGTAWENGSPDGALNLGRVLYSYKGDIKDLVIADGIEIIEQGVFIGCDTLKSVTFGEDVEEIGLYAFQNCANLETVTCGSAVSIVCAGAFKGCSSLKAVDFSVCTISAIGYEAFDGCSSLTDVKFNDTLTDIGARSFADTKITAVDLGKNVKEIGKNAFYGVETIEAFTVSEKNKDFSSADGVLYSKNGKDLILFPSAKTGAFEVPQKVVSIKEGAFRGSDISTLTFAEDTALETIGAGVFEDSKIGSVALPETVTTINNSAFKNATELKEVTLGNAVTFIGASAFEGCLSLKTVQLPDSLRDIASYAFRNAGLESVLVGNGVRRIDTGAFYGNKNLTDVKLGESIEKLGTDAFAMCEKLTSLVLPASVEAFDATVVEGCKSLKNVIVDDGSVFFKNIDSSVYTKDGKALVLALTKNPAFNVANGTEVIGDNAFVLVPFVSSISFPSTLTYIKNGALDNTVWFNSVKSGVLYAGKLLYKVKGDVKSLAIADGTVAVADYAADNAAVSSVSFPATVKIIGDYAFKGSSLKNVSLPDGITEIGDGAFENTETLEGVTLPKALVSLGSATFKGCTSLTGIVIPETVEEIATDTFANCTSLKTVDLGKVKNIGKYVFSGCTSLEKIVFPSSLENVDPISFLGCENLTAVDVEDGNAKYKTFNGAVVEFNGEDEWNKIVLYPQGKDGEFTVPENVTEIGDRAFYDCDGLTNIVFHGGFKNIGAESFFDCDGLTKIDMPDSARKIGSLAFASCNELREFVVNSNLTDYEDNAFDGCFYFNFDMVTINVADNSGIVLGVVAVVIILVCVIGYFVYNKKQKKVEQEVLAKIEKNKLREKQQ